MIYYSCLLAGCQRGQKGNGKLRNDMHDILRLKKEVKSFLNQFHPSFGYGATEIYFQY